MKRWLMALVGQHEIAPPPDPVALALERRVAAQAEAVDQAVTAADRAMHQELRLAHETIVGNAGRRRNGS